MEIESQAKPPFRIGILLYPNVEDLDFVGPLEVFTSASALVEQSTWEIFTVAETAALVATSGGMLVQPHYTFENHPPINLLLIPGGEQYTQMQNHVVLAWLRHVTTQAQYRTSVCTGAFLLAAIGLLDGHRATTHWSGVTEFAERFPHVQVATNNPRWVDDDTIITSGGVTAGMDMSLHLVERLAGRVVAQKVASYLDYTWDERGQE
jgi:transcriptional regulator GlxA family with amidase domain